MHAPIAFEPMVDSALVIAQTIAEEPSPFMSAEVKQVGAAGLYRLAR